ncbi:MAG TPA: prepilin-type N-terminal cleavage/methylation domain-containing protein [Gammaproteobacteria bacterium]
MQHVSEYYRPQEHGVTLIELMVVVIAIGILGAFAIPAFNGYVERSRTARAVGDIGTISLNLYRWQLGNQMFPATLAEAGIVATDPWGRPYEYTRVEGTPTNQLRKDHNLHPINTDFDLYSRGADGNTQKPLTAGPSRDDIIRANNGAYIGVAANY